MLDGYIKSMREYIGSKRLMIVGAGVYLHRGDKVMLQRRRDNHMWSDCGGAVEIGEMPEQAARRELFEETGITAGKLDLIGIYAGEDMMFTYPNGDEVYIIGIYYSCGDFSGDPKLDPDEVEDIRWFDFNNLPEESEICTTVRKSLHDFTGRRTSKTLSSKDGLTVIRPAGEKDSRSIFELNKINFTNDLTFAQASERIKKVLSRPSDRIFVAERGDKILGYVHVSDFELTFNRPLKSIVSIAVDDNCKRTGVGSLLMLAAEDWARESGCIGLYLVSGEEREGAHNFYRNIGFSYRKMQKNFVKYF